MRYLETPKTRVKIVCTMVWAVLLVAQASVTQTPRFQGPLGLNKALTGKVTKAKITAESPKRAARFLLTADGVVYQLHGHETELKKLVGKEARVTGKTAGENMTVDSVVAVKEK